MRQHCGGWLAWICGSVLASAAAGSEFAAELRRPAAAALSADERLAFVANRSGSISVVSLAEKTLLAEHRLGKQFSDLQPLDKPHWFLAADEAAHELLLLEAEGERLHVRQRLAVAAYPVSVACAADAGLAYVASLWSRRLSVVQVALEPSPRLTLQTTLDLPFAPRAQLVVPDRQALIVADAFGGKLAIIATDVPKLVRVREFPAHNIRGLGRSVDGRKLVVAHQMLNEMAHTIQNDVHWGLLMSNDLHWFLMDAVLADLGPADGKEALYRGSHMHPLGEPGRGAGDPAGMAFTAGGTVIVTMGGVDEVAVGREDDFSLQRIRFQSGGNVEYGDSEEYGPAEKSSGQRRPTAVCVSRDGRTACVVCSLSDSLAVIDLGDRKVTAEISLGPRPKLSARERGEQLFYNARLSHDGWMSCHSCHTDGHTNGQMNDNLSDGTFGAPKRVLSLLGLKDTAPFAWNAGAPDLEGQIRNSLIKTMNGRDKPTDEQVNDLAAFVRELTVPPPLDDVRAERDEPAVARGQKVFAARGCDRCHAPPLYTTPEVYDVGLKDQLGQTRFNPPSLRGVSQREPFFHDSRAATLEDVLQKHGHPDQAKWSAPDLADILAFLRSL